jgi:hypothetical protein
VGTVYGLLFEQDLSGTGFRCDVSVGELRQLHFGLLILDCSIFISRTSIVISVRTYGIRVHRTVVQVNDICPVTHRVNARGITYYAH